MLYRLLILLLSILLLSTLPVLVGLSGYIEYTKRLVIRKKLLGCMSKSEMNTYDLLAYIALTGLFVLLPLLVGRCFAMLKGIALEEGLKNKEKGTI
ncbi:hypothetical protein Q0590_36290 [Rhodocytophaga aerolata]|uniref:Uncharacterized protein n=1 Tax=Rhodocytophaga aerolata TaxID=455078 RepID=A0ABT8RI61_9BACT|nr:hypothetical protein [Rhodocytophaga aerolata]MDO1451791.1 hypothetical protein [Rhodocytophaga aerolata]